MAAERTSTERGSAKISLKEFGKANAFSDEDLRRLHAALTAADSGIVFWHNVGVPAIEQVDVVIEVKPAALTTVVAHLLTASGMAESHFRIFPIGIPAVEHFSVHASVSAPNEGQSARL